MGLILDRLLSIKDSQFPFIIVGLEECNKYLLFCPIFIHIHTSKEKRPLKVTLGGAFSCNATHKFHLEHFIFLYAGIGVHF